MSARPQLERRIGAALIAMIRTAEESVEAAARHQGMHPTDFRCLGYLYHLRQPASPRELAAKLSITSGACTALLDRLESANFVRRTHNPADRRSVLVVLDEQTAAEPIALHRRISADHTAALADFSQSDLEAIALYLERVRYLSLSLNEVLYPPTGTEKSASVTTSTRQRRQ